MKKILLLTKNRFKIEEYQKVFFGTDYELIDISTIDPNFIEAKDGYTYRQIAKNCAESAVRKYNMPVIYEKFGIEIAALKNMLGYDTDGILSNTPNLILEKKIYEKVNKTDNREAKYVCAIVYAAPNKPTIYVKEELELKVARKPKGESGLYLDNIFAVKGYRATYATLLDSDKEEVSPRSRAIKKLIKEIEKI